MIKKIGLICTAFILSHSLVFAQNDITIHDENTGKDESIELPEGMTYEIDSLLVEWHAKNYLSFDENCES